jgi:hypothetical protein
MMRARRPCAVWWPPQTVLVENFRPGVMDCLGLGYAFLKAANQTLFYCAISGFGQDGPRRFELYRPIAQLTDIMTTTMSNEYKARPPPIRKKGQFLVTFAVAIDFI